MTGWRAADGIRLVSTGSRAFAGDGQGAVTAFWLVMWVEVRGRWRAMASLALLLGLVGGVVLGAAAGARRTDSAYPRLRAWANASQLSVVPEGSGLNGYYAALARLPQAAAVAPEVLYNAGLPPAYAVRQARWCRR